MTAADAIDTLLTDEWTPSIPGRTTAVPDIVEDAEDGTGVLIVRNQEDLRRRLSTHDVIKVKHIDHQIEDKGRNSERVVDTVSITIRIAARDIDDDGLREGVETRMLGERDGANEADTLGGLKGEVKRILNGIRLGYKEWDKSSHTVDDQTIESSDARVVFTLELVIIERNIQQPI